MMMIIILIIIIIIIIMIMIIIIIMMRIRHADRAGAQAREFSPYEHSSYIIYGC